MPTKRIALLSVAVALAVLLAGGVALAAVLLADDVDRKDETFALGLWDYRVPADHGITMVASPVREGTHAVQFAVSESDVNPYGTDGYGRYFEKNRNPRANLVWNGLGREGQTNFIGNSIRVPADFPTFPEGGQDDWMVLNQHSFGGASSGDHAPIGLVIGENDTLALEVYDSVEDRKDVIWSRRLPKGAWFDVQVKQTYSDDPNVGAVALWFEGTRQPLTPPGGGSPVQTLNVRTLNYGDGSDGCENEGFYIGQYRSRGTIPGSQDVWFDGVKVGTTLADVQP